MKKLLLTTMLLGSTVAVAACTSNQQSDADLDGALTGAPYAEERTIGTTGGNVNLAVPKIKIPAAPVVRSAEPVFESSQVK